MKIQVNGAEVEVDDGIAIPALLRVRQVKSPDMVTVELNGEILQRQALESTVLKPGDRVEFLYFMGGGR